MPGLVGLRDIRRTATAVATTEGKATRLEGTPLSILKDARYKKRDIVIFYGTQSGTANELAKQLSQEISQHFSKASLVADFRDYSCESLAEIPSSRLVLFILSTYGEGDPSENAIKFGDWLLDSRRSSTDSHLPNLKYSILGLGNSNYKYYNRFAVQVHAALQRAGATPILDLSLADDAQGLTRDEFSTWKANLFEAFVRNLGIPERRKPYEPLLAIVPSHSEEPTGDIYRPVGMQLGRGSSIPTVYSASVTSIRNVTPQAKRSTLTVDIDITNEPKLKYAVGDHLAIWPENAASEVQQLGEILGLNEAEMHRLIEIDPLDPDTPKPWSGPVTLHALFKHHLDITSLIARDTIKGLKQFATDPDQQVVLDKMVTEYRKLSQIRRMTLASILRSASSGTPWNIPLSWVIENLSAMKPRYYSIASTPAVTPRTISFTVSVKEIHLTSDALLRGLVSGFLLERQTSSVDTSLPATSPLTIWCSVRKSKFKPPVLPSQPMIMVANGSGIAPFIGFLRHRLRSFQLKGEVGKMMLFYGCQDETTHLYKDEFEEIGAAFGGKLKSVVAYSRKGQGYVQNCLSSCKSELEELLCDGKANVYMCGSTNMAKSVREELLGILQQCQQWSAAEAQGFEATQLRMMKWQLDVWG
ncbi:hypothetical protein BJX65DRAFT_305358 [Aspergillus insuetus]